jgi:hypothetical protein
MKRQRVVATRNSCITSWCTQRKLTYVNGIEGAMSQMQPTMNGTPQKNWGG